MGSYVIIGLASLLEIHGLVLFDLRFIVWVALRVDGVIFVDSISADVDVSNVDGFFVTDTFVSTSTSFSLGTIGSSGILVKRSDGADSSVGGHVVDLPVNVSVRFPSECPCATDLLATTFDEMDSSGRRGVGLSVGY